MARSHCAKCKFNPPDSVELENRHEELFLKGVKSRKFSLLPLKLAPPLGWIQTPLMQFAVVVLVISGHQPPSVRNMSFNIWRNLVPTSGIKSRVVLGICSCDLQLQDNFDVCSAQKLHKRNDLNSWVSKSGSAPTAAASLSHGNSSAMGIFSPPLNCFPLILLFSPKQVNKASKEGDSEKGKHVRSSENSFVDIRHQK